MCGGDDGDGGCVVVVTGCDGRDDDDGGVDTGRNSDFC